MEIKRGGGCLSLFGLPFFLAGLFMLLACMQIIPFSNAHDIPWRVWPILALMGLVFSAVGGGLMFGRKWITLDINNGRIWEAWGLLRPMRGKMYNMKDYARLQLKFTAGDSDSADTYGLVLKSLNSGELSLVSYQDFGIAHEQAKLVADFLQLPFEDLSSEHAELHRPTDTTNKEANSGSNNRDITPPAEMRSIIQLQEDGISISIPYGSYSLFNLLQLLFPLTIAIYFADKVLPFFVQTSTPAPVQMAFGSFVSVFFVIIPLISMIKRYLAQRGYLMVVKVNNQGVEINKAKRKIKLPAESILGLDYGIAAQDIPPAKLSPAVVARLQRFVRSKGVIIKSKKGISYIGAGLPDDEVLYLYALIKSYLML